MVFTSAEKCYAALLGTFSKHRNNVYMYYIFILLKAVSTIMTYLGQKQSLYSKLLSSFLGWEFVKKKKQGCYNIVWVLWNNEKKSKEMIKY